MHFKEGGKRKEEGDEIIREAERERQGGECGIWLPACVFSYAMRNNHLVCKRLALCRGKKVRS